MSKKKGAKKGPADAGYLFLIYIINLEEVLIKN
jgi:hypothetical protein